MQATVPVPAEALCAAVSMPRASGGCCRVTFANENVSGVLGNVLSVLADNNINVVDMVNKSRGDIAYNIIDVESCPIDEVAEAICRVEHVINARVLK